MVTRTVLTYDGLLGAPNDGLRRELIGGELYVSIAPTPLHQRAVRTILVALDAYAQTHRGEAFVSPIDVVFSQTDAVQPDVIYIAADRLSLVGEQNVSGGAPHLIVEVISPASSEIDPGRKRDLYARYGVPEYWIVNPKTRVTVAHADSVDGRYARVISSEDGRVESITIPDLRLHLPALHHPA